MSRDKLDAWKQISPDIYEENTECFEHTQGNVLVLSPYFDTTAPDQTRVHPSGRRAKNKY
jgi:hypothetical protein